MSVVDVFVGLRIVELTGACPFEKENLRPEGPLEVVFPF